MQNSGTRIVIDTYAWVEYFRGSVEGERAAKIIDSDHELFTPTIVIAELSDKYRRENLVGIWEKERLEFLHLKSTIINLDSEIADLAGKIKLEKRKKYPGIRLADCVIIATGSKLDAQILTGDKHIKNEPHSIDVTGNRSRTQMESGDSYVDH